VSRTTNQESTLTRNSIPTEATRRELSDGRFEYSLDGNIVLKASKVDYEAVSIWGWPGLERSEWTYSFHKTEAAARNANSCPANRYANVRFRTLLVLDADGWQGVAA
jgi:hypothetical protein